MVDTTTGTTTTYTPELLFEKIKQEFCGRFKLRPEQVVLEAKLMDDLSLDSIDMFDLLTVFEKETGKTLELQDFRSVKTVGELVTSLYAGLQG